MKTRCFGFSANGRMEPLPDARPSAQWLDEGSMFWLDVEGATRDELVAFLEPLNLPAPLLDHVQDHETGGRVEPFGNALLCTLPLPASRGHSHWTYRSAVCLPSALILVHPSHESLLDHLFDAIAQGFRRIEPSVLGVFHTLLRACIHEEVAYFRTLRKETETLSHALESAPHDVEMNTILGLRRTVSHQAATMEDYLLVTMSIFNTETSGFLVRHDHEAYRDIAAQVREFQRRIERLDERLEHLHEHYLVALQDITGNRVRLLTMISAIFLPLTLIAGIYGMNFDDMPELHSTGGYPLVLASMALITIGMLLFFHSKGWFK